MILRKYMSLLGIGSARIDLILSKDTYKTGEHINGYYLINGGTIEQQIKRIDCELIQMDHSKGIEKMIDTQTISTTKLIESDELYKISFSFKLPTTLTVSTDKISYRFNTKLTFNEGVESRDEDIIYII
ncbi:sporulation protein [bacterium LRH843]|nr:sporulation protein [bacterium LRH843]